jgi:hypothetical protein
MMHTPVPRPEAIVHDVAMFLLNPPQIEAAGRQEWERARAAIAQLANDQCAAASAPLPSRPLPSNVVRLVPPRPRGRT